MPPKRLIYPTAVVFLALLLFGCATPTPRPAPLGASPIIAAGVPDPPLTVNGTESIYMPAAPSEVYLPEPGLVTGVGTVTTVATAQAYHARLAGDWTTAFAAMERAVAELDDNTDPVMRWWVLMTQQRLFLDDVRPAAAQALSEEVTRLELEVFGTDLVSAVVRGDLRLNQRDFAGARAWYGSVLARLDGWEPSASFFANPEDRSMQAYLLEALSRATVGMTIAYLLENDCARALAWATDMHDRMRDLVALPQWFPFNLFMEAGPDLQQGYGWTLALLGAARVCYSGDLAASEPMFERALDFFATVDAAAGPLIVASLWERSALRTGALKLPTHQVGVLPEPGDESEAAAPQQPTIPGELAMRLPNAGMRLSGAPPRIGDRARLKLETPAAGSMRLPEAGQFNAVGVAVSTELQDALQAYLRGDGEVALAALASAKPITPLEAWQLSYVRAQVLIMMGRAADAEQELEHTAELEITALGTNLNARALRGEARAWLADYPAAIADFQQVLAALGDWRPPGRVLFPPQDVPQLVVLTRALIRSYEGMAMALMLDGRYREALTWAERTEELLEEVFFLVFHPAYRYWLAIDADMFYGRGLNLGVLASAQLAGGDAAGAQVNYQSANAFFDALGFATGRVIVEGMRARALLDSGQAREAERVAAQAVKLAAARGLPDFIWQLEALRGRALLAIDKPREAEAAFRRAQTALNIVSGSLASDRAKRRFGVGKEDVTRALVRLDLERGDWAALFEDLERGRARAFVDMLGVRAAGAQGPAADLAAQIRDLDRAIRRQRLLNAAPGSASGGDVTGLLAQRQRAVAKLRRMDSELAGTLAVDAPRFGNIRARLAPGEALIYALPVDGPEAPIRLLLLSRSGTRLITTDLTPKNLRLLLRVFGGSDPLGAASIQHNRAKLLTTALGAKEWLPRRRLYVVPSGELYHLPWGMLNPDGDLTVEVVVLPTGGWLARTPKRLRSAGAAVVVGDPAFGDSYPQLPGARAESTLR